MKNKVNEHLLTDMRKSKERIVMEKILIVDDSILQAAQLKKILDEEVKPLIEQ